MSGSLTPASFKLCAVPGLEPAVPGLEPAVPGREGRELAAPGVVVLSRDTPLASVRWKVSMSSNATRSLSATSCRRGSASTGFSSMYSSDSSPASAFLRSSDSLAMGFPCKPSSFSGKARKRSRSSSWLSLLPDRSRISSDGQRVRHESGKASRQLSARLTSTSCVKTGPRFNPFATNRLPDTSNVDKFGKVPCAPEDKNATLSMKLPAKTNSSNFTKPLKASLVISRIWL
mmetsp:Transcript_57581/g.160359  ORF Transcript_57581/g.160359 Transcript_57581/m.160359 type:complete len:231 (+) Transcript_57581:1048-1740(+)